MCLILYHSIYKWMPSHLPSLISYFIVAVAIQIIMTKQPMRNDWLFETEFKSYLASSEKAEHGYKLTLTLECVTGDAVYIVFYRWFVTLYTCM